MIDYVYFDIVDPESTSCTPDIAENVPTSAANQSFDATSAATDLADWSHGQTRRA